MGVGCVGLVFTCVLKFQDVNFKIVDFLDGFFGCGCILLMCIGFYCQCRYWGHLGGMGGYILRCLGDSEDWVHIFVCF